MKKLAHYFSEWSKLSSYAKIKFVQAGFTLMAIKAGLTILPFSTFRRLFYILSKPGRYQEIPSHQIKETVRAVDTCANLLPFQLLCLPRALATKYLLRQVPSLSLEIGIEINREKDFEAHAWVQKGNEIIIGDWSGSTSYQRLWVWE